MLNVNTPVFAAIFHQCPTIFALFYNPQCSENYIIKKDPLKFPKKFKRVKVAKNQRVNDSKILRIRIAAEDLAPGIPLARIQNGVGIEVPAVAMPVDVDRPEHPGFITNIKNIRIAIGK
jgi:hypothetical protein